MPSRFWKTVLDRSRTKKVLKSPVLNGATSHVPPASLDNTRVSCVGQDKAPAGVIFRNCRKSEIFWIFLSAKGGRFWKKFSKANIHALRQGLEIIFTWALDGVVSKLPWFIKPREEHKNCE